MKEGKPQRTRYYFFLNPYEDCAFTRCPKCDGKTKLRKFPLAIHIEPHQLLFLNKTCRYCMNCDLIIAKKSEVESLMAATCETRNPSIIGNDYVIHGTLEKSDWRKYRTLSEDSAEVLDRVFLFKDILDFEVIPGKWHFSG